jgi:transposase
LAHFVRDTVREGLELSAIVGTYEEDRGQPRYHPAMMVALLLYGYARGVYSSRRLSQACEERVDFMAVTGLNKPDFRTVAEFRRRHLAALSELFVQVLELCRSAGLVKLGHVAVDGTKLKANASRHKAMSYGRMKQAAPRLAAEVAAWLAAAEEADAFRGRRARGGPAWRRDAGLDGRQATAAGAHPRGQGGAGGRGAGRSVRPRPGRPRPVFGDAGARPGQAGRGRRTAGQGAAQLHRSRQPHPADP